MFVPTRKPEKRNSKKVRQANLNASGSLHRSEALSLPDDAEVSITEAIPAEILFGIFQYLDATGLCRAALVCRLWHAVSIDDVLWGPVFKKRWRGEERRAAEQEDFKKHYASAKKRNDFAFVGRSGPLQMKESGSLMATKYWGELAGCTLGFWNLNGIELKGPTCKKSFNLCEVAQIHQKESNKSQFVITKKTGQTLTCSVTSERECEKWVKELLYVQEKYASDEAYTHLDLAKTEKASPYDFLCKLLLIGDSGVDKSGLLLRFADDSFTPTFVTTIGIDFKIRTVEIEGKKIKVQIWDTAGQERFRTITTAYYRGAMGVMLVFDLTDETSFLNLRNWLRNIEAYATTDISKILVGNKSDLVDQRVVTAERAQAFADEWNIPYIETSVKTGENVDEAFLTLITKVKHRLFDN